MAPLKFPRDSKDNTEKEHWPSLVQSYPAYKTFWEKFIGVRDSPDLKPYGLKKDDVALDDSTTEYKTYMKMCMCHYSIFCDIVIAQKELDDVKEPAQKRQSLEHWRHFEHFFVRLRSIQDRFRRMWKFAGDFCAASKGQFPEFLTHIKDNRDDTIIQKHNDWLKEVRAIRNNVVHFGRLGSVIIDEDFRIPKDVAGLSLRDADENVPWYSHARLTRKDFVPTVTKMNDYFARTFSWLDPLEKRLEDYLDKAMANSSIKINYDVIPAAWPSGRHTLFASEERDYSACSGASAYQGPIDEPIDQSCQSRCETTNESGTEELEQDGDPG